LDAKVLREYQLAAGVVSSLVYSFLTEWNTHRLNIHLDIVVRRRTDVTALHVFEEYTCIEKSH
jgi:hypothetical protein